MMKHHRTSNNQYASSNQSTFSIKRHVLQEVQEHQDDVYSVPRSVSTDDDEDDDGKKENIKAKQAKTSSKNPVAVKNTNNSMIVVETYLRQYEHMVQQQEIEEKAAMAHIMPCLQRLMELIHDTSNDRTPNLYKQQTFPIQLHHEISYQQLYNAHQQLIRMKTKSTSNASSFQTITAMECMSTDRQLMMILRTMTEKMNINFTQNITEEETSTLSISWAEFIQCYKVCISSMMLLQYLPKGSMARLRARDRSLSMMALFEPSTSPSSLVGFTDLYMSPTHHTFSSLPGGVILPNEFKSKHEESIVESATTATDTTASLLTTGQRRRPWLKKRTKRILPYLVFLILLFAFASWCYTNYMREENKCKYFTEENISNQGGTNKENYEHHQHGISEYPSRSIGTNQMNPSALIVEHVTLQHDAIPNGYYHPPMLTANSKEFQKHHRSDVPIQKHHKTNTNTAAINMNYTFEPSDDQATTPVRYHPLLGIWSNFNK